MNLVEDEEATTNKQSTSNFNFEKDLTRFALAELMKTKKFRDIWVDLAMEIAKDDYCKKSLEVENMLLGVKKLDANEKCQGGVKHNQSMILSFYDPVIKHRFIRQYKTPPPSLPPQSDPIITRLLEELSEGLLLAIRTFLRGTQMAYSCQIPNRNSSHEAASFYSVNIQFERFRASGNFHSPQFGLVVRGIKKLQQLFSNYVSSPYSIENCIFLSTSLLDILAKFLEYISLFEKVNHCCTELDWLYQNVEEFEKRVCQKLDRMLNSICRKKLEQGRKLHKSQSLQCVDFTAVNDRIILLPRSLNMINGLVRNIPPRQSFLIAPELEYDKAKMALSKQK